MGAMNFAHIDKLVRLYRLALKIALIVVGASVIAIFIQSSIVGYLTLGAVLLAVFAIRWAIARSESLVKVSGTDEAQARALYRRIWNVQKKAGALVTTMAIIMVPLAITGWNMGLSGELAIFAVVGGTWVHMKARKINRDVVALHSSASLESNEELGEVSPAIPAERESEAGLVPLIVASVLLAFNVIVELRFTNDLRSIPTFYNNPSTTNAVMSMNIGLSTVLDILVFSTIGVGVIVYAIVIRRRLTKKLFWLIAGITLAQLAIVQGTIAPVLAHALGPNVAGQKLQNQMGHAARTMQWIQSRQLPEGFSSAGQDGGQGAVQEEVNTRWTVLSSAFDQAFAERTCHGVIAYARALGAGNWVEKNTKTKGEVSDSAKVQRACIAAVGSYPKLKVQKVTVVSPEFILAGKALGGSNSPFAVQLTLLKQGTAGDYPNAWIYELEIRTAYNEDPLTLQGGLSDGTIEINDLLTLIGQERLATPNRNPTDPVFVRETLKLYNHDIAIRVFETKPGVADRLELTNSDGVHMCLSIDPWNEAEQGQEDPGYGYGLGFQQDLKVLHGFGNAVEGSCKP